MIEAKVKLLLQMSLILIWGMASLVSCCFFLFHFSFTERAMDANGHIGANKPVVRIARIAGQFAK
jgi:hypothetical protein